MNNLPRKLVLGFFPLVCLASLSHPAWNQIIGDLEELTGFAPPGHVVCVDAQHDLVAVGTRTVNESIIGDFALWLLDVSNPSLPSVPAALYPGFNGEEVLICGNLLYAFIHGQNSEGNFFVVVDITDPTEPLELGRLRERGYRMELKGSKVYFLSNLAGLTNGIIDITDPFSPFLLRDSLCGDLGEDSCSQPIGIDVSGSSAFFATVGPINGTEGLEIFDFADPLNPFPLSRMDLGRSGTDVKVHNDIAYVVTESPLGKLHIIDVSNPKDPRLINSQMPSLSAETLVVYQGHAYMAGAGLQIIDLADINNPKIVARNVYTEHTHDVAVSGTTVFLADDERGLVIMRFGQECIHSATLELRCAGGVVPSTEELRLRIHANLTQASGCHTVVTSGENLLADCAIDLSGYIGTTPPSCSILAQTLADDLAGCLTAQASGTLHVTRVEGATIVIESENPFALALCGNELASPCEEGTDLQFGQACRVVNIFDGKSGNEGSGDLEHGLGFYIRSAPCQGPFGECDTEDIPTRTPTPTVTFTPTASPTRTLKPCPPYDFHLDCRIDARDLLILFGQLLEGASDNELLGFSLYWYEVGEDF